MVGCGLDRGRSGEGIWPGGIWIDPEEGGDLFERSGWAGGEIEEKVGGRIRQIPRKSGGGARVGSLEIRVWSKNGHGGLLYITSEFLIGAFGPSD